MDSGVGLSANAKATLNWPAAKVELWPLARLVPHARNARTHTPDQIRQIAASMREWGWTMPVLADENATIIAGHGRVLAGELNGETQAPVMVARGWSEGKKRAYMLADNKLALNAGWDNDLLKLEVAELSDLGVDLGLTGFAAAELEAFFHQSGLPMPDEKGTAAEDETPTGYVRMLQVFCPQAEWPAFREALRVLGDHWQTATSTDTVLRAIRECAGALGPPA